MTTFPAVVSGTTIGYTANYDDAAGATCHGTSGADRTWRVTVPPGQILTATVTSNTSGFDPSIGLIVGPATACDAMPPVCVASDDSGVSTTVNSVSYVNSTGSGQSVFILIDTFQSSSTGDFTLNVSEAPPLPGDTCSSAVAIVAPGTLSGESTAGYSNDYNPSSLAPGCTGYGNAGRDKVYSILVGAGKTLTATVTPTTSTDPSIYILQNVAACIPSPTSCLGGGDSGGLGSADSATFTNSTGASVSVLIVVDSFFSGPAIYDLTTSIL